MPREQKLVALEDPAVRFANGTRLELPDFAGVATQWTGSGRGLRSPMLPAERDVAADFEQALDEVGVQVQETIHLDVRATSSAVRSATRRAAAADQVVLRPAAPAAEAVQVVWYQDESGGVSWHLPEGFLATAAVAAAADTPDPDALRRGVLRAARGASFVIPTRTVAAQRALAADAAGERLRGPIVKLGRKIFKVLVVPLSKLIARPVEAIVGKVERNHRQELVRGVTLDDYRQEVTAPFTDWAALDGQRALLVVHGIFSSTQGMLSGLPPAGMERLLAHYGGRVIALDQLTVSRSPEENAVGFLRTVAAARPRGRFSFDVLCHSRGGIVSRTLVERGAALVPGHPCSFRKVFFVAAPNAGSPLGDARHLLDMIDVFTNLLTNFPDGPVLYSIEVLLALIKLLAYTAAAELPGLRDMAPGGYIATTLNAVTTAAPAGYAAAASNYEPRPQDNAFFNGRLADSVIDRVFEKAANDLVVPRDGVFARNGHPSFPIADKLVYEASDHVWHTDYFTRTRTFDAICRHFEVPLQQALWVDPAPAPPPAEISAVDEESLVAERVDDLLGGEMEGLGPAGPIRRGGRMRGGQAGAGAPEPPPAPGRRGTRGGGRMRGGLTANGLGTKPPAPAAAAKPTVPAARLQRDPAIDFHEQVREGEQNKLTVRLADVAGSSAASLGIPLTAGAESVEIAVRLYAPGFEVKPNAVAKMTVHRERDAASEQVEFQVRARNPGKEPRPRELTAEFWLGNSVIGSVTHTTVVVPDGWTGSAPGDGSSRATPFAVPAQRREDCDLTLMIEGRDNPGEAPFRLRLRSEIPGNEYDSLDCRLLNLPQQNLSDYVRTALDGVIGQYPDAKGMNETAFAAAYEKWRQAFLARLGSLGKQLWTFLPQKFRDEYFRLHLQNTPPRSINVASDEMIFPWELVVPNEKIGARFVELPPLGIAHVLGRWKPELPRRPSPQRLRVESFVVLNPAYPAPDTLPWSVAESKALQKLFPKLEVFSPSTVGRVRSDLLPRGNVRLLHFSGHGNFATANADLSELLLEEGGTLAALDIARTPLGQEGGPIAYLNACSVGALGVTVGRAGGFAAVCLDGGFSGVVAPYWPVNDARAAKFAIELYQRLLGGRGIGEALRDLRDENRDDPTYLAFAYYGDPWTRLNFEPVL